MAAVQEKMEEDTPMTNTSGAAEDERKLFAGGLPQDAKEADIRAHFSTFGEIESVMLKTDQHTGRSRGFCFVLYKTVEGLKAALAAGEKHDMKGKKVAIKQAEAKQGKVYVGKLKPELSDDDIKNHFATFGTIANIEQPFDKIKNERKNFCFITFEKEEVAKTLLKEGSVYINGHELEVKKVNVKPQDNRQMHFGGGHPGGHHMMRGGGHQQWGGYGGGPGQGQWGGYGYDQWGQGGYGDFGGAGYYGAGGYGGYSGPQGYAGAGPAGGPPGGKTPRGGAGGPRGGGFMRGAGRGMQRGAQRQKPY